MARTVPGTEAKAKSSVSGVSPIDTVLRALEARGCKPRNTRGTQWVAKCPSHDDRKPSLSIAEGPDGRVLLHCHAGCSLEDVCGALGVELQHLFPTGGTKNPSAGNGSPKASAKPAVYPTAKEAILAYGRGSPNSFWVYKDAQGEPVAVVARWDTPQGKEIRPVVRDATGWKWGAPPEPRPLYRLPELLAASPEIPVIVTEGEKAAEAAVKCGLMAVTSFGGAKAASKTNWSPLSGRRVVILPDNDEAGEEYAEQVATLCRQAGAASIKILRLANYCHLPDGGDLADVVDAPERFGLPVGKAELGQWILETAERLPEVTIKEAPQETPLGALRIDVAPANGAVKRLVVVRCGERSFADRFDVFGSQQREAFAEKVAARFGLDKGKLVDFLDNVLPKKALKADQEFEAQEKENIREAGRPVVIEDVVPWEEQVDLAVVLDEALVKLREYVFVSEEGAVAIVLWAALTHIFDKFECCPRLALQSPTKGCGKTTALEFLECLVNRPLLHSGGTAAPLFRIIDRWSPTLLCDEADQWAKQDGDLAGILNSSHKKAGARVLRCHPVTLEPLEFRTWAPMAFAAIGRLKATLEDRSIVVVLHRKPGDVKLEKLTEKSKQDIRVIARKLRRWAIDTAASIDLISEPQNFPELSSSRSYDNWLPLVIIADLAGGRWPQLVRQAAVVLDAELSQADRQEVGVRLLACLAEILGDYSGESVSGKELVSKLQEKEEWASFSRGKPITAKAVAHLLAGFGVRPAHTKNGNVYSVNHLWCVINTYVPAMAKNTYAPEAALKNFSPTPPHNPSHPSPHNSSWDCEPQGRGMVKDGEGLVKDVNSTILHPISSEKTRTYDTVKDGEGLRRGAEEKNFPSRASPGHGEGCASFTHPSPILHRPSPHNSSGDCGPIHQVGDVEGSALGGEGNKLYSPANETSVKDHGGLPSASVSPDSRVEGFDNFSPTKRVPKPGEWVEWRV